MTLLDSESSNFFIWNPMVGVRNSTEKLSVIQFLLWMKNKENGHFQVRMLADTDASFTSALGLGQDLAVLGGVRSKRYSMVVEDGVVSGGINFLTKKKIHLIFFF